MFMILLNLWAYSIVGIFIAVPIISILMIMFAAIMGITIEAWSFIKEVAKEVHKDIKNIILNRRS